MPLSTATHLSRSPSFPPSLSVLATKWAAKRLFTSTAYKMKPLRRFLKAGTSSGKTNGVFPGVGLSECPLRKHYRAPHACDMFEEMSVAPASSNIRAGVLLTLHCLLHVVYSMHLKGAHRTQNTEHRTQNTDTRPCAQKRTKCVLCCHTSIGIEHTIAKSVCTDHAVQLEYSNSARALRTGGDVR